MPFTVEFIEQGRGILYVGAGVLMGSEVLAAKAALLADPDRVRNVLFLLVLLGDVTECPATTAEIRQLALLDQQIAQMNPDIVLAAVAPQDLMFGMARMWQAFTDTIGWTMAVFRSRAEADEWIRLTLAARAPSP